METRGGGLWWLVEALSSFLDSMESGGGVFPAALCTREGAVAPLGLHARAGRRGGEVGARGGAEFEEMKAGRGEASRPGRSTHSASEEPRRLQLLQVGVRRGRVGISEGVMRASPR